MKLFASVLALFLLAGSVFAIEDGWFQSREYPTWDEKYENGRVTEYFQLSTGKYQVWRGKLVGGRRFYEDTIPPIEWLKRTDQVDRYAVLRCGNMEQSVDGKQHGVGDNAVSLIGAPPPNDANKWHISVVWQPGCRMCSQLKSDWAKSDVLKAWALPDDPQASWSHLHWYMKGDESQSFRFKSITLAAYPTVLVTPPRTGADAEVVVMQKVYDGDPKHLSDWIRDAITRYSAKRPKITPAVNNPQPADECAPPPFTPPPKVDPPVNPNLPPNGPQPVIPPDAKPVFPNVDLATLKQYVPYILVGLAVLLLVFGGRKPAVAPVVPLAPVKEESAPDFSALLDGPQTAPVKTVDKDWHMWCGDKTEPKEDAPEDVLSRLFSGQAGGPHPLNALLAQWEAEDAQLAAECKRRQEERAAAAARLAGLK